MFSLEFLPNCDRRSEDAEAILKLPAQLYKDREVPVYRITPEDKLYPPLPGAVAPPVGQGILIVEASRPQSDTPHPVGPF